MGKESDAAAQGNRKMKLWILQKGGVRREFSCFKPKENIKLRGTEQEKYSAGDSESGILIDAPILFQSLGDMRKKGTQIGVNIGAVEAKTITLHLADGGGVYSPILDKNQNEIYHPTSYSKRWWHDLHLFKHVNRVCDPFHEC